MPSIDYTPYESATQHLRDELHVVEMLVLRALNRGSARGWHDNEIAVMPLETLVEAVRAIEVRVGQSTAMAVPMEIVRQRLGLGHTEQRTLWALIGFELDPKLRRMVRSVASEQIASVTLGTLMTVVYEDVSTAGSRSNNSRSAVHPSTARAIEPTDRNVPFSQRRVRIADRVLELASGTVRLDPAIAGFARIDETSVSVDDLEVDPEATRRLIDALSLDGPRLLLAHGRSGSGRRSVLHAIARQHAREVITVDCRAIALERETAERELRIVARECRLLGATPLLCHLDALTPNGEVKDRVDLVEKVFDEVVLATSTAPVARPWKRAIVTVELPPSTSTQREVLWARALPPASAGDASYLATAYPLAPGMIHAVGMAAMNAWNRDQPMVSNDFAVGIRAVLDNRLSGLATRLTITQEWKDLVLPDDQSYAMLELLARIRERRTVYEDWKFADRVGKGLGVSALFSGAPGTGKSMAAGLIAKSLDLEIYQVDLSKITSKWIGETEKNLAMLFDAAEAGHAILLFDEADALFGKRTTVQSSNDRHANQETNYLLQRIEHFAGICILTTNHDAAIDEAFRRRISCHVRFPLPDADERQRLWSTLLTGTAPLDGELDLARLARTFVMSGGYIRNAVLRAAFLAADSSRKITGELLQRAAQLEYEAMGKIA